MPTRRRRRVMMHVFKIVSKWGLIICLGAIFIVSGATPAHSYPPYGWPDSAKALALIMKHALYPPDIGELIHACEKFRKLPKKPEEEGELDTIPCIEAMAKIVDEHSDYLPEEEYRKKEEVHNQEISGGIGISFRKEDKKLPMIRNVFDGPAKRAGIQKGDEIITVNGEFMENLTTSEIKTLLIGKPGTSVMIDINRPGTKEKLPSITITREKVRIPSVFSKIVGKDVGYVKVEYFGEKTAKEIDQAVTGFSKPISGLILDFTNNLGGKLDASIETSNIFLKEDLTIMFWLYKDYDENLEDFVAEAPFVADETLIAEGIPMVVLIDSGSASASEVVTAALQENGRATVIGRRSYGKGTSQKSIPLISRLTSSGEPITNGALLITSGKWETPSGKTVSSIGIKPDIEVPMGEDLIERALEYLK